MLTPLSLHPRSPRTPVTAINASASRAGRGLLYLAYRADCDLSGVRLPAPATPERTDGLWRATCFEAFLQPAGEAAYFEFNLSPSRQWAAYRFDGYREGMRPADLPPPVVETKVTPGGLDLTAVLDLSALGTAAGSDWRLGLAAVVEAADGGISYWALAHPPGDPDFHHPAGFVLPLQA